MLTLYQYVEAKGAGKILMTKQMPATLSQKENKSLLRLRAFLKTWECNCTIPRAASSISLGKIAQIGSRMSFRCNNMSFSCRLHLNKKGKK